jgi:hypothetical protein
MWGNALKVASLRGIDIKLDACWILIPGLIVWSLPTAYFPPQLPGADTATLIPSALPRLSCTNWPMQRLQDISDCAYPALPSFCSGELRNCPPNPREAKVNSGSRLPD